MYGVSRGSSLLGYIAADFTQAEGVGPSPTE